MKKVFLGIFAFLSIASCLTLFACGGTNQEQFGLFTHNGYALKTFKSDDLNYSQAKSIITNTSFISLTTNEDSDIEDDIETLVDIDELMNKYASVKIITKYWESDSKDPEENTTTVPTTYLETIFKNNEHQIITGMIVKNVFINENLLENLENLNSQFNDKYAPFTDIYSYHKNDDNCFVLRANDYSEIKAETIGGVSAIFIQQNESLYNENNLIVKFQSSFGMQFQTPSGTLEQGTVLEVEFVWNEK